MSPRYDYDCPSCGDRFELRQSFDSEPVAPCPSCQTESKRVLYAPQVVYNSDGFYTSEQKKTGFGSYWNRKAEAEDQGKMDPDTGVGAY